MKRAWPRDVVLYLREERLVGFRVRKGRVQKVVDCPLQDPRPLQRVAGPVSLVLHRASLEHRVVSVPARAKVGLRQVMAHEASDLKGLPAEELAFGWRMLGIEQEEGVPRQRYLLGVCPREEIRGIAEGLGKAGFQVTDVLSGLDLLVEYGRRVMGEKPGLLVVFDQELVHTIFFKGAAYGFHRVFRSGRELFDEELLLEFQRSSYYAKQRHKAAVEQIRVALAPPWFHEDMASSVGAALQVPCTVLPPPPSHEGFPELGLLNLLLQERNLSQQLFSVIPPEVRRHRHLKRIAALSTSVELLLLGVMVVALVILYGAVQSDKELVQGYARSLGLLERTLASRKGEIQELESLKQAVSSARQILSQKPELFVHLEAVSYLVPEQIRLESLKWTSEVASSPRPQGRSDRGQAQPGAEQPGRLFLEGKVLADDPSSRYEIFSRWLEELRAEFPGSDLGLHTGDLLDRGGFRLSLPTSGGVK